MKRLCIYLLLFALLASLFACTGAVHEARCCKVCRRSFTDILNTRVIAQTNMCRQCYANLRWTKLH